MKTKIITLSDIRNHPNLSLSASEYIHDDSIIDVRLRNKGDEEIQNEGAILDGGYNKEL